MARLTFPDQQQDLQNAADYRMASECDGSVKFPRLGGEADSRGLRCPDGVWVGSGVSEVLGAFVTSLAGVYRHLRPPVVSRGRLPLEQATLPLHPKALRISQPPTDPAALARIAPSGVRL